MEFTEKRQRWKKINALTPQKMELAHFLLNKIREGEDVMTLIRRHPLEGGGYLNKAALVAAYKQKVEAGQIEPDPALLEKIRMKPMRTLSGVTTVTVLTKPYPCPGKCIFCPTDARMPKSYLPDEPGAMRALEHEFDPFTQVESRIRALKNLGHPTDKIELLILGGTWSSYKRDYQEWFVARCFDAMNCSYHGDHRDHGEEQNEISVDSVSSVANLPAIHTLNETARHRNVGLVIETRPDEINPDEIKWLRHLGVTKVQLGAQSFDDHILEVNKRGHDVESTRRAVALLRAAGFKIVLHWMPNLLGATPESDRADFSRLWNDHCPDEIKIYPNQLLANAELYEYWQRGEFKPYTTQELVELIADIKPSIPRYCRVNRVIRDIPGNNVVEGNRRTSLRQDVHDEMKKRGTKCQCVRCREVKGRAVEISSLALSDLVYPAGEAEEHFISFNTAQDALAGFIRLSLPSQKSPETGLADLNGAALIREVHVYGQSLGVGVEKTGAAQHVGLGTRLLEEAERIAKENRFKKLAVIAAVGARQYYLDRGFERGQYYLVKEIA
ncbi:MAG: tRNA uridine(34) 5-carboxymethylaminomethyl modification radical SAM/GNAT enzyme Elp3 [Chloroflexi bacterium CFX1]|nr:tRNA uridine(34) 5-carboxymethylaminomethyl modification radical SAM/GNAT enzyme Elp3 [Chloroflexi bacterium CFX1]MCQ3954625.1 tRNA uridine(34) 5-carboxymethylaminomethyl modification radical SAM/GNAT enzyme Elp3 [Chloroflexota bacterium]MDL1920352.1 tRNA uridine(34) 5-carboxymethylaminomethyl modification radical SAM/GNAT enzyme Elp3 [Chloroflexi bacterium CFX5]NUQ60049.1 tRNA uridine(34) 5-carboxymethylaminomethyl modification radical SAM/GNAT enzyme Elp3 [Anaerolineales bacterium]